MFRVVLRYALLLVLFALIALMTPWLKENISSSTWQTIRNVLAVTKQYFDWITWGFIGLIACINIATVGRQLVVALRRGDKAKIQKSAISFVLTLLWTAFMAVLILVCFRYFLNN